MATNKYFSLLNESIHRILVYLSNISQSYYLSQYLAKDISFTPTSENFKATNVQDALNELYSKDANISILWYCTDNLVKPESTCEKDLKISKSGKIIVDIAAVDGNSKLASNWQYYVKVNSITQKSTSSFANEWNGHAYYLIEVSENDDINVYSKIPFSANYNSTSAAIYYISK